ncbi:MAG: hypothetical protein WCW52_11075 [Elusimicrobiales bacterium]|jgi:Skp family chaperone for outer membrane proteins
MKKLTVFLSALALFATARGWALELSLEENKGESGTVGYVDIDRVFKEYSGTLNAREEFLGEIKKKEESVNQRKQEIYALKADLAKLRQEREFALTLPSLLATEEQMNSVAAPAAPVQPAASVPGPAETAVSTIAAVPAAASTQTAASSPVPGPSEGAGAVRAAVPISASTRTSALTPMPAGAAVNASSTTAAAAPTAAQGQAPRPPAASVLPGAGIDMPGVSKVPVNFFKFSVSTAVPEIDAALAAKETALKQKEESLKLYQHQVEKELLEYESHRSEILLGRIYIALKELAVREEVSVIIDKRNILFGHSAVDLTGKLLKKLEEPQ